jgi:hypothetical protein
MTNINWSELVDATEDNKRAADMLIRPDDGVEHRVPYNGTLFATAPFTRYGARFFLNASENANVWDKAIMLQRTHSP